ncbi:restriction endonuclease subunit S [Corynebacterium phoceense]|uniref:restriction endonuclease subunit S n=1 Tax=Corynebacterium phoceense TaxID=1686286 RepID=UPI0034CDED24
MRELTKFAIGGGWGAEESDEDTQKVMVIRGADFPAAALQDLSSIPTRFEKSSKVSNRALSPGDIVLEISGGTKDRPTGRTVFVTQKMVDDAASPLIPASFCRRLVIDSDKADPRFVYYWLQNMYATGQTWNYQNRSTGIANFQFEQFLDREKVYLPDRQMQLTIGMLLGALDDKISTNIRIINATDGLVDVLYSRVPKMPTEQSFAKVVQVFGGSTPSTKNDAFWNGDINWATPTDITALDGPWIGDTSRKITEAGLSSMSSSLHPENSILLTSRATIGAIALASEPIATNQGFIVVEAPDELTPWLFAQMKARKREFEAWANGATFMELSRGNFKKLPFIGCSDDDLQAFNDAAWPLLKRAQAAQKENQVLARTRDELLPLLMSGRITVGEAEDAADEAASES